MMIIVFKAQTEIAAGNIKFQYKPLSTEGCGYNFTEPLTTTTAPTFVQDQEKQIYHISYLYYTLLGSLIVLFTSVILSCIFGFQDATEVDPRLLAPFMRKFIKSKPNKLQLSNINGRETVIHNFDTKENSLTS
jgi:solute carrier family 5 (sodium-coupled monocarboxylate transporter), member 8/12